MDRPAIHLTVEDHVATLRVDNERKWNALTVPMLDDLEAHCRTIENDASIRAVIVTGTGPKAFCCGADITAWGPMEPADFARLWVRAGHRIFDRLAQLSVPTIAAMNGHTFGGGLELASACDIRIMAPNAAIALPEASVGVVPGWSGTQRLAGQIPQALVKEMALLGRKIPAERAHQVGFVNALSDDPVALAQEWIAEMMPLAPLSIEVNKSMIGAATGEAVAAAVETLAGGMIAATADKAEGVAAFTGKRKPNFQGK